VGTIYLLNFSQTNNYDFISQHNYIIDCQNACRKRRRVAGNPGRIWTARKGGYMWHYFKLEKNC
jgi:hypothetical protein